MNCQAQSVGVTCVNGQLNADKCVCYMGYGGANCTEKACPYGISETDSPYGDLDDDGIITNKRVKTEWYPMGFGIRESGSGVDHPYRECSNAGKCDRKTGKCKCNNGYEGSACQRKGCISSSKDKKVCNGHGMCIRGKDVLKLSDPLVDVTNDWSLDFNYKCVCYYPYNGTFCDKKDCEYGFDPTIYTTDYIFGYTLLSDSNTEGDGNGNTIAHYYEFNYRGYTYKSAVISKYEGICGEKSKLDIEKMRLFKDELSKKIGMFPYFSILNIELKCTDGKINNDNGYSDGKYLTVIIKLDYMNIDVIKDMEFKVLKENSEEKTTAIRDGVNSDGKIDGSTPNALWLMRHIKLIGTEITCYSNSKYKINPGKSDSIIKSPIDLATLCSNSVISTGQLSTRSDAFTVHHQTECSSKGKCDSVSGRCICDKNYYGTACSKKQTV